MFQMIYEEWLATSYLPIAGADGDDDDDTSTDDTTSTDDDTSTSDDTTATGDDDATDDTTSDDDTSTDADEDELERVRSDREDLRKKLANAEAAARKAKQEARKAREDAAKKGGNWEQVAKEREAELADANEARQTAETKAVEAEEALDSFKREVRITRIANKLAFRDTADPLAHLANKADLTGDDKSCERALRQLAKEKPYLIDQKRARGRAMANGGTGGGLTHEQLKNMTAEEINAAWESGQAQQALARGPGGG